MDIGYISLLLALICSMFSVVSFSSDRKNLVNFGRYALIGTFSFVTISSVILLYYLVTRDFQVEYVAMHTDRNLPLFYTVSAFWAGSPGSLLLWSWFLSIFSVGVLFKEKKDTLTHYSLAILMSVESFFLFILIGSLNPFKRLDFVPIDGQGLNPLLQNIGMAFHPPTLFIGYAGLAIPFAFAISGVLTNNEGWIYRVRKWTLFSWLFLGLGIILGGWWAYVILGWGGYWAWDPVENASLLPWLTSTAFLHSVMIQETKRGMKLWNILLILLTFEFVIFGTFLTRSGVLSSVHAFAGSNIGPYFMAYMLSMLIFSLGVIAMKYDQIRSKDIFESAFSKETTFLVNNLLFVVSALTIFWGTIFPLISEWIKGVQVSVGPEFYNQIQAPIGILLLILVGFCVLTPWRRFSLENFKEMFRYPLLASLIPVMLLLFMGYFEPYVILATYFVFFSAIAHFQEFYQDYRRFKKHDESSSIFRLIVKRRRKYGGYLVHFSIFLIITGIAFSTLYEEKHSFSLGMGEQTRIGKHTFVFVDNNFEHHANKMVWTVELEIRENEKLIGKAKPTYSEFLTPKQYNFSPDIVSTLTKDIYVILEGISGEGASFVVRFLPLISLIWIGGVLMSLGIIVALIPKRFVES
ncbi:MAG: heme lyase CcmF/NrfE family subunit [Candidatus Hydrothermarchaeota archaeon]